MFQVYTIDKNKRGILFNGTYKECIDLVNNMDKEEREQYQEINITDEGKILNRVCVGCGLIMGNDKFYVTPTTDYKVCYQCRLKYFMQEIENINKEA